MAIVRHTTQYSDAYLDISYYVPPHQYTPADIEMYLISPRPQFPPHEPPVPVREFLIVSDLADPIAHRNILTAYFNATNIEYPKKEKDLMDKKRRPILKEGNSPLEKTLKNEAKRRGSSAKWGLETLKTQLLCCKLSRRKYPPQPPTMLSKMQAVAES
uniref:Uncharacterized protein n=1 Tax=Magallana gigas TaxID=29159 RepID=A0A8W8MXI4_MAGGI|nr:uncharacterized protein LOC105335176 isoform X1 [Crassostrea gigas]